MIDIDGSFGEGGGQIVRSSLALSMVTGQPFRIDNIRSNRPKAGLLRQHLTAVRAAAEVCGGTVSGAELGSTSFLFTPGEIRGGDYKFAIGSAGSTTLVLQTVLPALMTAGEASSIEISGGTHNTYAPSVHFLRRAFLPIIEKMGPRVSVKLDRHGFYPAGGGQISVRIEPASSLNAIELLERGELVRKRAVATVADLSGDIAERELAVVNSKLSWSDDELQIEHVAKGSGPGNVLSMELEYEYITEVFTGFGERNLSASKVANKTVSEVKKFLVTDVPVWENLADQLMLPFALAHGGSFRTTRLTPHSKTNISVIEHFMDIRFEQQQQSVDSMLISVL
jgi:RNA 3'-terminal phosphate cyclase (ATP)